MAQKTFHEVDDYILDRWNQAIAFKEAFESVCEKSWEVAQRVADAAKTRREPFDSSKATSSDGGSVVISRKKWRTTSDNWRPGLWICYIGIESLYSETCEDPFAIISSPKIFPSAEAKVSAVTRIKRQIIPMLPGEVSKNIESDESQSNLFWWNFSSKAELRDAIRKGDSSDFVKIITRQIEYFETILPTVELHLVARTKGK